jgi:putative zinc finger/helix-turn-helix YgiT family protein
MTVQNLEGKAMNELRNNARLTSDEDLKCPSCGNSVVETKRLSHTFTYGDGPSAVELIATVDARKCAECGFEFLDSDAEDAKHEAICKHLCVLTPREIKSIRDSYGLSRSDFAQLTKLGEATLGRWERGALIQNGAYDHFLFLLTLPANLQHLRERQKVHCEEPAARAAQVSGDMSQRFRALARTETFQEVSKRANTFKLYRGEAA